MQLTENAIGVACDRFDFYVPTQCIESFTQLRQVMVYLDDVELTTIRQLKCVSATSGADCVAVHNDDMTVWIKGCCNLRPKRLEPLHWYMGQPESCEDKVVRLWQIKVEDVSSNSGDAWVIDPIDAQGMHLR